MTIYTVSEKSNEFTIYNDEALLSRRLIYVLSVSITFTTNDIPDTSSIYCSEINLNKRLFNGKRSNLLIQIINNQKHQISFNANHKQFIDLISKDYLSSLSFRITNDKGMPVANIKSVDMDIEII